MKKILLSCVTCLLALGLVTACDNEDEDVSGGGGDSTLQDSGTGGGSDTGSGSGGDVTPETVTLSNYTVSFSFVDEENNPTTLGDGYSLYLAGSWDNWAKDSWIECLYDEATGYYTGTFESIVTGTYEYKGVACETGSPSWSGDEVVTNEYGGNASLTVTESNSGQVIKVTIVEPTYVYNYTLSITLTNENGEDPIPSYATAYIAGDWDKWTEFLPLTSEGSGVYSYTFTSITTGWHSFRGYMWYKGETVNWDNCVEIFHDTYEEKGETLPCDASFEVTGVIADGGKSELNFVVTETLEERIVNVTGVSIAEGTSIVMAPNETKQLTAVVTPSNATDQSVTWAVKDEGDTEPTDPVVSVDETGLVKAGDDTGTATVVVTTTDGEYTAETEVTVASNETIVYDFTLTITLDEGVTIPDYAGLYLSYNDSYTLLEFNDSTATVSLGNVIVGTTLTYSVYLDYSEEYREAGGYPEVTEDNIVISGTHIVAEGDTGDTLTISSINDVLTAPVTVHETYTLTIYFAEEINGQMVYYTIPERGYAEVGGYYASETWADPAEDTKLTANAADSSGHVSYTVTLSNVRIANFQCRIFYFYNDEENYHEGADFWLDVNPFEDEATVYIAQDPESILVDPEDPSNFCELTIAIKNTNASSTGFAEGLAPQFYHWVGNSPDSAFVNMNQGACGSYTSDTDYYFTIDSTNGVSDGGGRTYRVAKGEGFSFQVSHSDTTNQWASAIHLTSDVQWSESLPLSNGSDGSINITEGYLNHDSVLVVLGFDFSAYVSKAWGDGSNLYNVIVTEAQFIVDWNVQTQG